MQQDIFRTKSEVGFGPNKYVRCYTDVIRIDLVAVCHLSELRLSLPFVTFLHLHKSTLSMHQPSDQRCKNPYILTNLSVLKIFAF